MNGYEKFFKEAKRANGSPASSNKAEKPTQRKPQFELSERTRRSSQSPEDALRAALAEKMREKKKRATRKKQEFPIFAAVCVVLALVTGGIGYFNPDLLDEAFGSIEIGAFGKAQAAGKQAEAKPQGKAANKNEAKPAAKEAETGEKSADAAAEEAAKAAVSDAKTKGESVPDIKNWSAEELSFFKKLNERKQELDLRETELVKLEEELQKQKAELDEKIKQLESMRSQISQTLKTRVANDQEKVGKLVQFYSDMKPQQAAKVIETINEDLAVEVLDRMKKKNAAEIMNMMDAKKARRLSELLTGYQRTPAATSKEQAPSEPEAEPET